MVRPQVGVFTGPSHETRKKISFFLLQDSKLRENGGGRNLITISEKKREKELKAS